MAITHNTKANSPVSHVIGDSILTAYSAVSRMINSIGIAIEKAQTKKILSNLSNRELEDIGISRADIPFVVKEIFSKSDK